MDEWDGETVGRLVEFLYTGNYQYPEPVSITERAGAERTIQRKLKAIIPSAGGEASTSLTRPLTPLDDCLNGFFPLDYDDRADWTKLESFDPQDNYREALFSHAKVYCLAQHKSIGALRTLALRRIFLIFLKIDPVTPQPEAHGVVNLIDLANYIYTNTDRLVSSEEPLRKLVSHFAAHNIRALETRQEMSDLMNEPSDFVSDLIMKILRQLSTSLRRPVIAEYEPNPTIGNFNTAEVHNPSDPWLRTSKIVSFYQTYPTPPGLPVGINTIDIGNNDNIRINAYASNPGRDRFTINIDGWHNTRVFSAGCSWLQIPSTDPNFQFGRYSTKEDRQQHQTQTSRLITFPRTYAAPPTVVVMLSNLDMHHNTVWRVRTYVTDVTARNFVIHIDTWLESILHSAEATWIAYPAGMPRVASGRFDTKDVRPLHPPQLVTAGHVGFAQGNFASTPRAMVGFDSLNIDCCCNLRLRVDHSNMTTAGMNWQISGWADTVVYCAGAAYIALV